MTGTAAGKRPKMRLRECCVRLACAIALALAYVPMTAQPAYASFYYDGAGTDASPQYVLNDHTVYALHFSATAPAYPNMTWQVNARLSDSLGAGGYTSARGFTWNPETRRWVQNREHARNFPSFVADASGSLSGWVYFKCGDEFFTGWPAGNGHDNDQAHFTIVIQDAAGGQTGSPVDSPVVTVLDAKTEGAWAHNGAATGASAASRAEALKSDDAGVSYGLAHTEPNGADDDENGVVDDEDSGPAGLAGDFRFGVPPAASMNVALNGSPWAPGQGVSSGATDTDVAIGAADHTPPSAPGNLHATSGDGRVTLGWDASSDTGGSGLSGYRIYRVTGTRYDTTGTGNPILTSALPVVVGKAGAGATSFPDTSAVNGGDYHYFVRATDSDTNVSARSNTITATASPAAPFTSIAGLVDGWSKLPVTFTLSGTGGIAPLTTYYALNGGAVTTYTVPVTISTPGTTTVTYHSVDSSGQVEPDKTAAITVDGVPPETTLSGVTDGAVYSEPVTLTLSSTDQGSGVAKIDYRLDSQPPTITYSTPFVISTPGVHSIHYMALDVAFNKEQGHDATFTISAAAPYTSVSGIPPTWSRTPVTFSLDATGDAPPLTTHYALGAGATATYTAPVEVSAEGTTTLSYFTTDSLARAEATKSATIRIDTIAPQTFSEAVSSYVGSASIDMMATDASPGSGVASLYYVLDGATTTVLGARTTVDVTTAGAHTLEFWSQDAAGNVELPHNTAAFTIALVPARIAGATRYDTAAKLSASRFATGACDSVVIATGRLFPDALCAAGLAGAISGPVLLTGDSLSATTVAEAVRVTSGVSGRRAYIIGSEAAVTAGVATQLAGAGFVVERISGPDRYATAAAVAARIATLEGASFSRKAFVTRGDLFPDALAVGPFAYSQHYPILLTRPTALTDVTAATITMLGVTDIVIPGSAAAVSDGVASSIGALPGVNPPVRQGGATRYDTAMAVVDYAMGQGWGTAAYVGVATGENYPDALAGSPVAGANNGVLLLTGGADLTPQAAAFLTAHKSEIATCEVYGGPSVLGPVVMQQIESLLQP